jgi:predicted 3-demethylubiquinone-9 3-methyltransferase (glyoxalase superfamily)
VSIFAAVVRRIVKGAIARSMTETAMKQKARISPCLWFDGCAEEAAKFYVGIFPNSKITGISHYPGTGQEIHGQKEGTVLTVEFELDGQPVTALNGGPQFKFSEAISLQVDCRTQAEIDHYWNALTAGGSEQPCGWLKDRYGLSWQIVPAQIVEWMTGDPVKSARAFAAIMPMKKLDIATLQKAYNG